MVYPQTRWLTGQLRFTSVTVHIADYGRVFGKVTLLRGLVSNVCNVFLIFDGCSSAAACAHGTFWPSLQFRPSALYYLVCLWTRPRMEQKYAMISQKLTLQATLLGCWVLFRGNAVCEIPTMFMFWFTLLLQFLWSHQGEPRHGTAHPVLAWHPCEGAGHGGPVQGQEELRASAVHERQHLHRAVAGGGGEPQAEGCAVTVANASLRLCP